LQHAVRRETATPRMLADQLRIRRQVHAGDLVLGHVALHPLDGRAHLMEHAARLLGNGPELGRRERTRIGNLALDEEAGHQWWLPRAATLSAAFAQFTVGFQSEKIPEGLFFQIQTCSAQRSKSFRTSSWPKSTGGSSEVQAAAGITYSSPTSRRWPFGPGSYISASGRSISTILSRRPTLT